MRYEKLGNTSIEVSKICLGTMTWGEQNTEAEAHEQLDYALEQGINFIDTAEMYPVPPMEPTQGRTEQYIGSWFAARSNRERVILATKAAGPAEWLPYLRGGPRFNEAHLTEALHGSLKRLQTDYIDLYQLHWPERHTNYFGQLGFTPGDDGDAVPLEQTLTVLDGFIKKGKIRSWGLSNETPWGLMKAISISDQLGMPRPVSVQNPYNLLNRVYEVGMAECSHREQVGLLAYSPLAFGVLTGKYLNGARPEGARITLYKRFSRYTHERAEAAVQAYNELAQAHGVSLTQLALAFVNSRAFVTSNIIGATSMAQLKENIDSLSLELSDELVQELDRLHEQHTYPCP